MVSTQNHNGVLCIEGKSNPAAKMGVYIFFVDGMLIDSSSPNILQHVTPILERLTIDFVVFTHVHEDHTGGGRWLEENKKVPLYIHPMSIEECAKRADYPAYRKAAWGIRKPFKAEALTDVIFSKTETWNVIHTPGHSNDHMSFLNKDRGFVFTGDLFVTPKPKIFLKWESIPITIASLERLLSYDFQEIFCSHTGYHQNGRNLLEMKVHYLKEIQEKIITFYKQGMTIEEISQTLFPQNQPLIAVSNREWDTVYGVTSVLENIK